MLIWIVPSFHIRGDATVHKQAVEAQHYTIQH